MNFKRVFLLLFLLPLVKCRSKYPITMLKNLMNRILEETSVPVECSSHLKHLAMDFFSGKHWALSMIDAFGKVPPGVLYGSHMLLGNYDQCLAINEPIANSEHPIRGQYCSVKIVPRKNRINNINFIFDFDTVFKRLNYSNAGAVQTILRNKNVLAGLCIPASCTITHLKSLWDYVDLSLGTDIQVDFSEEQCYYKGKPITENNSLDWYIFAYFAIVILILVSSTIYEIFFYDNEIYKNDYVAALSMRKNLDKICSIRTGHENTNCINGIRVLTLFWVILGHRFLCNVTTFNVNTAYIFKWSKDIGNTFIYGSLICVETYFAISGLLVSYLYLSFTTGKKVTVNILSFYILRIIRLTPALFSVILFQIAFAKYLGDGPFWNTIIPKSTEHCMKYGWANLLFINNIVASKSLCMSHTWHLSADSQLYLFFPLLFFSVSRNPKKTFRILAIISSLSIMHIFYNTIANGYGATLLDGKVSFHDAIHLSTIARVPSWLIGITCGYFVYKYKDTKFEIPKLTNIILLSLCFANLLATVLGQTIFVRTEYNAIRAALFNAISKPLWSLCVCWIIFACSTGNGGCVNSFLSLPFFNVLEKLNYSMFLVHMNVIYVLTYRKRTFDSLDNVKLIHQVSGDIVIVIGVAFLNALLFEYPVISLGQMIFKRFEDMAKANRKKLKQNNVKIITKYILWMIPMQVEDKKMLDPKTD